MCAQVNAPAFGNPIVVNREAGGFVGWFEVYADGQLDYQMRQSYLIAIPGFRFPYGLRVEPDSP